MCGCMLMHAMMGHGEGEHSGHSAQSGPGDEASMAATHSGLKCRHCGGTISSAYAFCPNCGMSLKPSKCPACGQGVELSWKTCAYCGHPLGESELHQAAA
jgi:predicted amidophosphoribosyltransferase